MENTDGQRKLTSLPESSDDSSQNEQQQGANHGDDRERLSKKTNSTESTQKASEAPSGRKRCRKLGARPRRAGGVSEHYNTLTSHRSPSSVADAIEHIAERIMVKAAEQATRVVDREANRTRK